MYDAFLLFAITFSVSQCHRCIPSHSLDKACRLRPGHSQMLPSSAPRACLLMRSYIHTVERQLDQICHAGGIHSVVQITPGSSERREDGERKPYSGQAPVSLPIRSWDMTPKHLNLILGMNTSRHNSLAEISLDIDVRLYYWLYPTAVSPSRNSLRSGYKCSEIPPSPLALHPHSPKASTS